MLHGKTGLQNGESTSRLLKFLLKVKLCSCTPAVYAECGRFPLVIKQKVQILTYWKRILN